MKQFLFLRIVHLSIYWHMHGLINYLDTKENCCHLKKLTCKEIFLQGFIVVHRLERHPDMLVFSTQLCELLPL
jgi:hypothetical protein